jgi:tetratricopeptide (TPR) repeat protein
MAQRRVNVKAVGIILMVLVALMGSLVVAKMVFFRKDPKKFIQLAERYQKEGNLAEAEINYKSAMDADPKNIETRIRYGDVLNKLAHTDESYANRDRQQWDAVLAMDPKNKEALERMLTAEIDIVERAGTPDPRSFTRLHDYAEKVLRLPLDSAKDPQEQKKNAELRSSAEAYLHISLIAGWFADIITPPEVITDNTEALDRLLKVQLDAAIREKSEAGVINPDVPYFLGASLVKQARELRAQGKEKEAAQLEMRASTMFEKVLAAQPKDAIVRLRYSQVLRSISDSLDDDSKDDKQEYIQKMRKVLEEARGFVQDTDRAFTEVYTFYADFLLRNKDGAGAEKLLRELHQRKPQDQVGRLRLAGVLHMDPSKREEAIDLLKQPVTDTGDSAVLATRTKTAMERETLMSLTNYLIESYAATADLAKRKALGTEIDDTYHKLTDRVGVTPYTLKLKGKISLVKGGRNGAIEAIPELEKAKDMWQQMNPNRKVSDWDLEYLLARAYFDSNQTGVAKQKLFDIVEALPGEITPRLMLTQLLLGDHELELAREQLIELKKLAPNDPQVDRLQQAMYFSDPKKLTGAEIENGLKNMPEKTPEEIRLKVQLYFAAHRLDDAVRLLEVLRKANPADVEAVRTLAQIYMATDKKDQAIAITNEALAVDPKNISIQIVRALIDKDQTKVSELTVKGIEGIAQPFDREMSFYDYYNTRNKKDEALAHLAAAEKLKPDSVRVLDLRFTTDLVEHNWDDAEKRADRLGVINADEAHGMIYKYRLALARGNFKLAEEHAREMVKSLPQFAQSWLCFGEVLKEQHQYEEAASKYQMALSKQGENLEAYRGLIECFYELKKPEEAIRYIEQGLKILPDNPWLSEQRIAWLLNWSPDPTKALEPRKAAADKNPESLGAQLVYGASQWQVAQHFANKGQSAEAAKYVEAARKTLEAVIAKWPDERIAYAYLADMAIYTSDFAGGEKILQAYAALPSTKDSPDAKLMLADFYARFGKSDLAAPAYDQVLSNLRSRTDPAGIDMARRIAGFYSGLRQFDKALQVLEPAAADRRVQQQMIEILMGANKFTEASALLDKHLQAQPNDPQFLATKGFLLMLQKKTPEALDILNKAINLEPRNQIALYYRGMIRLQQVPPAMDEAIKDLSAARDSAEDPRQQASVATQLQTRVALAKALRVHGQIDEAVNELTRCIQIQPGNKEIRIELIELLGTLVTPRWNDVERLIAEAEKMKDFEKDPDWRRLEAQMWVTRNQPEKALARIREAIALSQGQSQRTLPLMQDYLSILARLKKYQQLQAECDELLKSPELAKSSWWIYQMRAIALSFTEGKRPDALNDFDKALAIAAEISNSDATAVIIQTIVDTIGLDPAIERCEREANKGDNHWRVILTYLYFSKKDYAKAEATIEAVLAAPQKLKPEEVEPAYSVAGSVYMLTGKYDKADAMYQKILKTRPEDIMALNNLACLWADLLDKPDPAKALTYSNRAMEIIQAHNITDPNSLDTHGWVLTCNDRADEAISYLQASVDSHATVDAHYHLGIALMKKNLAIEAQQHLEKARKMLDDRKNKGQLVDAKLEAHLNDAIVKVKQMINGGAGAAVAPDSLGTPVVAKP